MAKTIKTIKKEVVESLYQNSMTRMTSENGLPKLEHVKPEDYANKCDMTEAINNFVHALEREGFAIVKVQKMED